MFNRAWLSLLLVGMLTGCLYQVRSVSWPEPYRRVVVAGLDEHSPLFAALTDQLEARKVVLDSSGAAALRIQIGAIARHDRVLSVGEDGGPSRRLLQNEVSVTVTNLRSGAQWPSQTFASRADLREDAGRLLASMNEYQQVSDSIDRRLAERIVDYIGRHLQ